VLFSYRERRLPHLSVATVALQQACHPRSSPFRQGGADVESAPLGAPPKLHLHRSDCARRRRRSRRIATKRSAGCGEAGEVASVEAGQDDGQELGGQLQQRGSRLSRGGWRQKVGAQLGSDGEALGSLLVAEARRGELALAGRGAQGG